MNGANAARWMAGCAAVLGAALLSGCEFGSADETYRSVGVDFSGYYTRGSSSNGLQKLVARNSGAAITSLDLRQAGDQLEAIDNNNKVWKGSIGEFNGSTASFELQGTTTSGTEGRFSGTLTSSSGGGGFGTNSASGPTTGTMQGTYIESSFYSTFYGTASIPGLTPTVTNTPSPTNSVNTNTNTTTSTLGARTPILRPRSLWFYPA